MSAHWLAEIRIPGQVAEGKLRHPFLKGIREDLARSSRRNRNATPTRIPFLCGQYRTDATGMKGRLRVYVGQCSGGGCGLVEEPPSLERVRSRLSSTDCAYRLRQAIKHWLGTRSGGGQVYSCRLTRSGLICRPLDRLARISFRLERPIDEVITAARVGCRIRPASMAILDLAADVGGHLGLKL